MEVKMSQVWYIKLLSLYQLLKKIMDVDCWKHMANNLLVKTILELAES